MNRERHSAIYTGTLRHRRFHPKQHAFSYQSTLFYIDLDELPELFSDVRGWSLEGRGLGRFCRADYLGDPAIPLKQAVQQETMRLLGDCPTGPVRMLTNLRIWGFCFNPVTFYYLFDEQGERPRAILAQVNNTPWNERHCYAMHCDSANGKVHTAFDKQFHVSPFNPLAMRYHWVSTSPSEHLLVHMENHSTPTDSSDAILHMDATLTLSREAWAGRALRKILWIQPWLAIKVPVAIYWQALKLLLKRVPVYNHTSSPTTKADAAQLSRAGEIS